MKTLFFFSLLLSFSLQASTCKLLSDCVNETSKLTGIKYIYPENMFSNKDELNVEMILNKENADTVLSEALNIFEYMKLPTKVENVWQIIPGRDIRYHGDLPVFQASKKVTPALPKNHDPVQMVYQAQPGTDVGDIARSLRPFISRYGRVIDTKGGTIIVVDRASVVAHVLPMIQREDVPLSNAEKLNREKNNQRHHELEMAKMKNSNGPKAN